MSSKLTVCQYDENCYNLFDSNHTHYFIHTCPFGKDCSLLTNKKHNLTFKHETNFSKEIIRKAKHFFSDVSNVIQGIDDEQLVSLRCPNWENCKLTNDSNHNFQFYHPCKYGLNCKSLLDENKEFSHKFKFHHPCKYGEKCYNKERWHRYCFIHGSDEPVWKECHGVNEKKKKQIDSTNQSSSQKPAKNQTTYQAHYGNNQKGTSSVSNSHQQHHQQNQPPPIQYANPKILQPIANYPNQAIQNYPPQNFYNPQNSGKQFQHFHVSPVQNNQVIIGSRSENLPQTNLSFPPPTILVCSYNILAQCYISLSRYSNITNQKYLDWEIRKYKIFSVLKERRFDIIGLQEIDNQHASQIQFFLEQEGFSVYHSYKNYPKKDGLILAIRNTKFEIFNKGEKTLVKEYPEVFQYVIARDRVKGRFFCIINCHLTFQPRDTGPREKQVNEILNQIGKIADPQKTSIIWFGDFNTSPHEKPIQLIEACESIPLQKSHDTVQEFWTCCGTTGRNSIVDYIWHSPSLQVKDSGPCLEFVPKSSIPDEDHGSDHLPLFAEFLY
ncbi:predicted protein [Naegleria gruberi]|uniref:Predicted protein n=1 Tax=Naegleria gruberi TaxID=5762 RepID=D2VYX2_NAEGR|nr:uncharacterized protein NAEGRDRAFT_74275 [Naegleria gruberi]EFC38027.1 predicted protein [Naegleria gruberi]|eukprot:XP_002670771.1 predicted protein [Naegleria gruberi strain NEG-M]